MDLENKLKAYYATAILGVVFAVIGFTYNAWRLVVSEDNTNIRTAAFAVLNELAELEQTIYSAHYDQDNINGSPRKGWVKVGLIVDLSMLMGDSVEQSAVALKANWTENWQSVAQDRATTNELIEKIDDVRSEIKSQLTMLD